MLTKVPLFNQYNKNNNIVKYYYNKKVFYVLMYIFYVFLLCQIFSSHGPSEIILICWFTAKNIWADTFCF